MPRRSIAGVHAMRAKMTRSLAEPLVLLSEPALLQRLRQLLELPLESGPLAQWLVVPLQPLKLLLQVASLAVVLPQAVSYPQRKRLSWVELVRR